MKIFYLAIFLACTILIIGCKSNKTNSDVDMSNVATKNDQTIDQNSTVYEGVNMEEGDFIKLKVSGKTTENYSITIYRNSFTKFKGLHNTTPYGDYKGDTSPELLESIFQYVDILNLEDMKTDMTGGMGGAIYNMEIHLNGVSKKVSYKQAAKLGLQKLQTEIIKAKNSISWKK